MDVNVTLATWSNLLIYSAMAVYAIAFLLYSTDLFGRTGSLRTAGDEQQRSRTAAEAPDTQAAEHDASAESAETAETAGARGSRVRRTRRAVAAGSGQAGRQGSAAAVLEHEKPAGASGTEDGAADGTAAHGTAAEATNADGTDGEGGAPSGRRAARMATALTVLAVLLHVAAVATRSLSVMRVPWGNMMEYALVASAIAVIVYLVVCRFSDIRFLGTFVAGGALVALGLCITVFYTPAAQLVPALQSYWIWIHVPIAILSTGLLSVSAVLALFQILKARAERTGARSGWMRFLSRVPASERIEQLSYRLAAVGFATWTFTLVAGAVWAEVAWGRYWGWDPKEIWTFVVFVFYAAYLHARLTRGFNGTQIAVLNIIGFASVLFNYGIVNVYFDGLHSYSGL